MLDGLLQFGFTGLLECRGRAARRDTGQERVPVKIHVVPFEARFVAVRGGVWKEAAHSAIYGGPSPALRRIFAEHIGDQVHRTVGAGFGGGRFEATVGADFSERSDLILLGANVRFK
jgi:hypothetical protein